MCWTVLVSTTHPVLTFSSLSPQPFVTCTQWEPCFWSLETRLPGSSPRSGECPFSFVHKGHKTRPPVQSFCETKQDLTNTVQSTINQKVLNTSSLFTSSVMCDLHLVCQPVQAQTPWERLLVTLDIQVFQSVTDITWFLNVWTNCLEKHTHIGCSYQILDIQNKETKIKRRKACSIPLKLFLISAGLKSSRHSLRAVWWRTTTRGPAQRPSSNIPSFEICPMRGKSASSSRTTSTEPRRREAREVSLIRYIRHVSLCVLLMSKQMTFLYHEDGNRHVQHRAK